jgi:hypothetical protein
LVVGGVLAAAFVAMVVVVDAISAAGVYTMVPAVAVAILSIGVPVVMAEIMAAPSIYTEDKVMFLKCASLLYQQPSALQK